MGDEQNGHGLSRLDRIERAVEFIAEDHLRFRKEHIHLLTAQILLTDSIDKLTERMDALAGITRQVEKSHKEVWEAQKHTDERLNVLVLMVDDLIRRPLA